MKKQNKGFTLVELLIVIVIIGILAAIIIPSVSSAIDKANFASDQSDAKNMNTTLLAYCTTNGIDPSELEAPEVRSIVSSQDKNYTFVPKSNNGIFWYNTAKGEIEVTQTGMPTETSKIGNAVYADGTIDSIEEVVEGYLYLNTQGELANWLRKLRSLTSKDVYDELVEQAEGFANYSSRLKEIVEEYDPATTFFVNATGGFTAQGTETFAKKAVFDSNMLIIPSQNYVVQFEATAVIRIPVTVEVVMPGAFTSVYTSNKIEACKKTKFIDGSLSEPLKRANSITYTTIDTDAIKAANELITVSELKDNGRTYNNSIWLEVIRSSGDITGWKEISSGDANFATVEKVNLFDFNEENCCTLVNLACLGVKNEDVKIDTKAFVSAHSNITVLSIQMNPTYDTILKSYIVEYHIQAFDSTGMVLNVIIVVLS